MRIIHVANFYGPKSGGIKTTLHSLGAGYSADGDEFIFIVPGKKFARESQEFGGCITLPSWPIPFSGGYRVIKSSRKVISLLDALKPDRLEVSDRFTLSCLGRWAHKKGIPAIVFSHETLKGLVKNYLGLSLNNFVKWHNAKLAGKFDYVITTTNFASSEFREIGTSNMVKVPLGVDLENFSPDRYNAELIQALRELLNRGVNARLVFIGSGPLHKKLYDSSRDIPVTFWGYVANKKLLAEMIASADISLAPGPIETFCLAALESLASGTPVVASNTSAVGEFLTSDDGARVGLTAENNGPAFADAIQEMLHIASRDSQLSSRCRLQAENFPWSQTISKLNSLYLEHPVQAA